MPTPLIPQEIFLIERYISLEYMGDLRDTWGKMIAHLERCLDEFMRDLPPFYRRRPLPEQPDAVWGQRVLPNFRDTYQALCDGYIKLSHGDIRGLSACHGPLCDFKGQMEYWSDWMVRHDENTYGLLLNSAVSMAGNIGFTEEALWEPTRLSTTFLESSRGPLDPPVNWPAYRLTSAVNVTTGAPLRRSGIYLPDIPGSCAQFLSKEYKVAPQARIISGTRNLLDPTTGTKYGEELVFAKHSCNWTLVERIFDSFAPPAHQLSYRQFKDE